MRSVGTTLGVLGALLLLSATHLAITKYDLSSARDATRAFGAFTSAFVVLAFGYYLLRRGGRTSVNGFTTTRSVAGKAIVFLLAVCAIAIVGLAVRASFLPREQKDRVWATVSTDPPKFSVEMPSKPKKSILPQEGPNGHVDFTMYESNDAGVTYMAGFVQYPPTSEFAKDSTAVAEDLNTLSDQLRAKLKGRLLYRKAISLNAHSGREQAMEIAPPIEEPDRRTALHFSRVYFVRDSMCILTFVLLKDRFDKDHPRMQARMARFFDSFKPE